LVGEVQKERLGKVFELVSGPFALVAAKTWKEPSSEQAGTNTWKTTFTGDSRITKVMTAV
jgi:hypothetical protein